MSTAIVRNSWHGLWNLVQRPFFERLSLKARIHPFSVLTGRKQITVGARSRIGPQSRLCVEEGGSIQIGDRCNIGPSAMLLTYGGKIQLGDDCSVNPFSILYGHGGLEIGNGVRIAAHVVIIPANHNFDKLDVPIHRQGVSAQGIVIEDDVWIGANATILDGVRIGRGAIVAAGAVVNRNVEPRHIVGGVPARTLRQRT